MHHFPTLLKSSNARIMRRVFIGHGGAAVAELAHHQDAAGGRGRVHRLGRQPSDLTDSYSAAEQVMLRTGTVRQTLALSVVG